MLGPVCVLEMFCLLAIADSCDQSDFIIDLVW
ncbi:hypothetical protein ES703_31749 [subsurface metagenome]